MEGKTWFAGERGRKTVSRKSLRTVRVKRFVDGRHRRCFRGATADDKKNTPDGCVNSAFNVETVEGKVARVASSAPQ